jgi:hemin uptake protein HemP
MSTSESQLPRPQQAPQSEKPRSLTSEELIGPHRHELVIRHAGSDYRLRITRHGKLILTK